MEYKYIYIYIYIQINPISWEGIVPILPLCSCWVSFHSLPAMPPSQRISEKYIYIYIFIYLYKGISSGVGGDNMGAEWDIDIE